MPGVPVSSFLVATDQDAALCVTKFDLTSARSETLVLTVPNDLFAIYTQCIADHDSHVPTGVHMCI